MKAQILPHPSSLLALDDPRHQPVSEAARDALAVPSMPDDLCIGCGLPRSLHFSISKRFMGCTHALQQRTPAKNPERWNDPYPAVTCEARKSLLANCGPAMEIHCAVYTHDELLAVAHQLAKDIIAAYKRECAK